MTEMDMAAPGSGGKSRMVKVVIVLLLVAAVGATLYAKNGAVQKTEPTAVVDPTVKLPTLLDLGATKCIPCKMMAPILEELKSEYAGKLQVIFIDVWQNPDASKEHGINMIPTQLFFDAEGKELFRHEGFFSKEDILNKWKELGVELVSPPVF